MSSTGSKPATDLKMSTDKHYGDVYFTYYSLLTVFSAQN